MSRRALLHPNKLKYVGTVITVDTTKGDGLSSFRIPINTSYSYNYTIKTSSGFTIPGITSYYDVLFASPGVYDIEITGQYPCFFFNNIDSVYGKDAAKIIDIKNWGNVAYQSFYRAFMGCQNLVSFSAVDVPDLSSVTSFANCFQNSKFNGDISAWDMSNVTSMTEMFRSATNFNKSINDWDVGNVLSMGSMFLGATNFNQDLDNWSIREGSNLSYMFSGASNFNGDISTWRLFNSNVTYMFQNASKFNQNLSDWTMGNVTNMEGMFDNAILFNGDISTWDVSKVTNMKFTFRNAKKFNQSLNGWNTGKVTTLESTFQGASVFNGNIAAWDVRKVTTMRMTFRDCPFNQNISSWQTDVLASIFNIFQDNRQFNQTLAGWDFSNVTETNDAFIGASSISALILNGMSVSFRIDATAMTGTALDDLANSVADRTGVAARSVRMSPAQQASCNQSLWTTKNWTIINP